MCARGFYINRNGLLSLPQSQLLSLSVRCGFLFSAIRSLMLVAPNSQICCYLHKSACQPDCVATLDLASLWPIPPPPLMWYGRAESCAILQQHNNPPCKHNLYRIYSVRNRNDQFRLARIKWESFFILKASKSTLADVHHFSLSDRDLHFWRCGRMLLYIIHIEIYFFKL